jgi:predicted nucleotidyltransferase
MRLTTRELSAIEQAAKECFAPHAMIWLFGSRLDDNRRGGDIDLLVEPPASLAPRELVNKRNRFIARLYRLLGEQRIDVLIVPAGSPDDRAVIQAARREGRLLASVPE